MVGRFLPVMVIFAMLVGILTGCASLGIQSSNDVFNEIGILAKQEGTYESGGWEAARQNGDRLIVIVKMNRDGKGGACFIEIPPGCRTFCLVGYYPGFEEGEYLVGLIQDGFVTHREAISKEDAEKIGRGLLDKYKAGKKTTTKEFCTPKPVL